jgi:hypothetical protein
VGISKREGAMPAISRGRDSGAFPVDEESEFRKPGGDARRGPANRQIRRGSGQVIRISEYIKGPDYPILKKI